MRKILEHKKDSDDGGFKAGQSESLLDSEDIALELSKPKNLIKEIEGWTKEQKTAFKHKALNILLQG